MKKGKVYKSKHGEAVLMELYDRQLKSLNVEYEDLWVETRFGQSHLIKVGNSSGKTVLFIHGGNNTTPFSLLKKCNVPTLLIPSEKNCMFPGKNIIKKMEKTPHNFKIHLLKSQGHMFKLSDIGMNMIKEFINE